MPDFDARSARRSESAPLMSRSTLCAALRDIAGVRVVYLRMLFFTPAPFCMLTPVTFIAARHAPPDAARFF